MVAIVNSLNRSLYERELEDMFKFRHDVAVGEMGWDLPDVKPGWEQDEFDTDACTYLLDWDRKGRMSACVRLIPTNLPHLMSGVFPDYCDLAPVPDDPKILECSRFLVRKTDTTKEAFVSARSRVMVAMHEYAFANGFKAISALTYQKHYQLAAFLFKTRPLGTARYSEADDDHYIAMVKEVSEAGIEKMSRYLNTGRHVGRYQVPLWAASRFADQAAPSALPEMA